jgi:hypothetical protein
VFPLWRKLYFVIDENAFVLYNILDTK